MSTNNKLTPQERSVLSLVARGWRNAKIASELYISPRTVDNHLYHIFDKLGVTCRTEAAMRALNMGLTAEAEMDNLAHNV